MHSPNVIREYPQRCYGEITNEGLNPLSDDSGSHCLENIQGDLPGIQQLGRRLRAFYLVPETA